MKEMFLIDTVIEVDAQIIARLDEKIKKSKTIPLEEKELWDRVHLYPETLTKGLIEWIRKQ